MSIPTEDEITIELDKQVKCGIMERVKSGDKFAYRFSKVGMTIMNKIFANQELDQTEKELLIKAGLNLESLKISKPTLSQDGNWENKS